MLQSLVLEVRDLDRSDALRYWLSSHPCHHRVSSDNILDLGVSS